MKWRRHAWPIAPLPPRLRQAHRAVDCLKDGRRLADVAGGRQAQAADQAGTQVRRDVAVQVGHDLHSVGEARSEEGREGVEVAARAPAQCVAAASCLPAVSPAALSP